MSLVKTTLPFEIMRFVEASTMPIVVSSSISKARNKLKYTAFEELLDLSSSEIAKEKTFKGHEVLAMDSLYEMIKVEPPQKVAKHDGVSPIRVDGKTTSELYNNLWDYLVPATGVAKTAQGEVIRIAGRIAYEIMDNGGINWDDDYKKMLDVFPVYCEQGNKLSKEEIDEIKSIAKKIYHGNGDDEAEKLMDYAVRWIMQNQAVLPVIQSGYKR